jgi:hypothetical protein
MFQCSVWPLEMQRIERKQYNQHACDKIRAVLFAVTCPCFLGSQTDPKKIPSQVHHAPDKIRCNAESRKVKAKLRSGKTFKKQKYDNRSLVKRKYTQARASMPTLGQENRNLRPE